MKIEPSKYIVTAWVRLMRAQKSAMTSIERALKAAGLPPLAWYDVLLELDRADRLGLRPYELERKLLLPQYGLSRLLDRIEAAGHLERRPCEEDRRGQVVVITKSGKVLRRRMWPIYGAALQRAMGARLSDEEATQLGSLLERLVRPEDD